MAARLRRSDCSGPGFRRIRRGRGFSYLDQQGRPIEDPDVVARIRELAVPPAWKEVWICADPRGHLQATGLDAAGRKQYLYHARWRERRDREKFRRMLRFARALPRLRRRLAKQLARDHADREQVLSCALRLLDVGLFRVGGEEYAEEDHGLGLATVRREHVSIQGETVIFDYPGKGGARRMHAIEDPLTRELIGALKRRRSGPAELLAYRQNGSWRALRAEEINDYLKTQAGEEFSAKDFRTWNATVLAAVLLAADGHGASSKTARKRAMNTAVRGVADMLGNTPAVARRSYIDPRVFDRYLSGWTIAGALAHSRDLDPVDDRARARLERAVIDLIEDEEDSPVLARYPT